MGTIGDIEQAHCAKPAPAWEAEHMAALKSGDNFYKDPETGLMVMTEHAHRSRGKCCGSGCRHCPFAHESVPVTRRGQLVHRPSWLVPPAFESSNTSGASPDGCGNSRTIAEQRGSTSNAMAPERSRPSTTTATRPIIVLFWSTGKDSFLALRALKRIAAGKATPADPPVNVPLGALIVLLTTFDANTRMIAHQDTSVDDAVRQARALDIPLLGVPLLRGGDASDGGTGGGGYIPTVHRALAHIRGTLGCSGNSRSGKSEKGYAVGGGAEVIGLAFGDLHLAHVRMWREAARLQGAGEELLFPLWKREEADMLRELEGCGVPCVVSAVAEEGQGIVQEGERFGWALWEKARAAGIDGFGENGEFQTLACVWDAVRT